jgi:hypothetical protein
VVGVLALAHPARADRADAAARKAMASAARAAAQRYRRRLPRHLMLPYARDPDGYVLLVHLGRFLFAMFTFHVAQYGFAVMAIISVGGISACRNRLRSQ